jgi:uncharacterized protein (TIGR03435 family)
MKRSETNVRKILTRYLGRYGDPLPKDEVSAIEQVWEKLKPEGVLTPMSVAMEAEPARVWRFPVLAIVGAGLAVLVSVVMVRHFIWTNSEHAVVQVAGGDMVRVSGDKTKSVRSGESVEANEIVRSTGGGAMLTLADGSHVEMRAQSELSLERADDGVRIRLNNGSVIVNAAKQRTGHLYVQTKDVTVSVVGTVFFVNAGEEGSHVAVIQGEVHVLQGSDQRQLHSGEQVDTTPTVGMVPVGTEISWSRNAASHLALLQRSAVASAESAASNKAEFDVASVRPSRPIASADGDKPTSTPTSLRHFRYGPQGIDVRTSTLRALIVEAYQFQSYKGGSSRILSINSRTDDLLNETYDVIAHAEHTVSKNELRLMLQALLADRFKLSLHPESKQQPVYRLVIGKQDLGLQPSTSDVENPHWLRESGSLVFRDATLAQFCALLSEYMDRPVLDSTGIQGPFNFPYLEGASSSEEGQSVIFGALQKLGLRLTADKAPLEYLVVDHVEIPSEN